MCEEESVKEIKIKENSTSERKVCLVFCFVFVYQNKWIFCKEWIIPRSFSFD